MSPSASEIAKVAADMAATVLDKTCSIARPTGAQTAGGHSNGATTQVASGVKCNLARPSHGLLALLAARITEASTWDLAVPNGTDIRAGDSVTVGSDTFVVSNNFDGETWQFLLHVLVSEVK